ncbi:MAG: hypothetical protein GY699_25655 [Desulfobacteraceae bacterium]|nr:hypothetical protein [Desulfobacteraceae bacterium]
MIKRLIIFTIMCLFVTGAVSAEMAPQFKKSAKNKTDMSSTAPNYGKVHKKDEVMERNVNTGGQVMENNVNKPGQVMENNMNKPEQVMENNVNKGKQVMENNLNKGKQVME